MFNQAGGIELEASVMVSSGYIKRSAAVSLLRHVKNPILLVKKILENGEQDMAEGSSFRDNSAQGHVHVSGSQAESLANAYGLELRPQKYFWTRKRWEEHQRGLKDGPLPEMPPPLCENLCHSDAMNMDEDSWDGYEYLPQGTVGCIVMDMNGVVCTATSTGGLTNKLPGRIGDTPTIGAGFWAEGTSQASKVINYKEIVSLSAMRYPLTHLIAIASSAVSECLSVHLPSPRYGMNGYEPVSEKPDLVQYHVLGVLGTGNGDSFLRVAGCRTAAAFALPPQIPPHLLQASSINKISGIDLQTAVTAVAGPDGILQQSAGDRWHRTGEGEGGMIGIERRGWESKVVFDFNCGGVFRSYIDDKDRTILGIFRGDDEVVSIT